MDKAAFFRIQCPPNRKNREIFKTFEKNYSTTSGFFTRCSKPLPCRPPAPGEVFLAFSWDKVYSIYTYFARRYMLDDNSE